MGKIKVPVYGTVGKAVHVEADAPSRTEMNAAIATAVQNVSTPAATTSSSLGVTLWRLIREIPANITALANLATTGLIARTGSGTVAARSVDVASTSRLTVTNGNGVSGNPTLDMADVSAVSVWGRASNTSGKPAAIQAAANDRVVARVSDQVAFQQLTVGMAPDGVWTYAKLQDVSAASKLLGRGAGSGAGDVEEITLGTGLSMTGTTLNASGGSGGGNVTPDTHPNTPNAADDEFEAGSFNTTLWTWLDQGTSTVSQSQGSVVITSPVESSFHWRGVEQTISGTGKWRCKIAGYMPTNFNFGGIYVRNTTSSRIMAMCLRVAGTVVAIKDDSTTSSPSTPAGPSNTDPDYGSNALPKYLEIEIDATNIYLRISGTGVDGTFVTYYSEALSTYIAASGSVNRVGLGVFSGSSSSAARIIVDWFRKVA